MTATVAVTAMIIMCAQAPTSVVSASVLAETARPWEAYINVLMPVYRCRSAATALPHAAGCAAAALPHAAGSSHYPADCGRQLSLTPDLLTAKGTRIDGHVPLLSAGHVWYAQSSRAPLLDACCGLCFSELCPWTE